MKFYDRKKEIEILRRNWEKSAKHSLFTVMIGRRRIGKTLLLLKTEQEQKMLYLYVSKDNERDEKIGGKVSYDTLQSIT